MKSVFIVFNQALGERVADLLDSLNARGFTQWQDVMGRGTVKGEPHMGTHTWPAMNSAIMTVVDENLAEKILSGISKINQTAELQGIKAFSWNIEEMV